MEKKMLDLEVDKQYRIKMFGQEQLPIVTVKSKNIDTERILNVDVYWLEWDNDFKSWANRKSPRIGHYFMDYGIANQGRTSTFQEPNHAIIRSCLSVEDMCLRCGEALGKCACENWEDDDPDLFMNKFK